MVQSKMQKVNRIHQVSVHDTQHLLSTLHISFATTNKARGVRMPCSLFQAELNEAVSSPHANAGVPSVSTAKAI
jgi:hypothetical protein